MKASKFLIFALSVFCFFVGMKAAAFPSFDAKSMPAADAQITKALTDLKQQQDQDAYDPQSLIKAVLANNPSWVNEVLADKRISIETADEEGRTPLMLSTRKGMKIEIMHALLKANANVLVTDKKGRTALIHAARNDNAEAVLFLCRAKSEVDATDKFNWTSALYGASNSNREIIKTLADYNANFTPAEQGQDSPLFLAIENNNRDVFLEILRGGANIYYKGLNNMTPLMYAAYKNSAQLIPLILKTEVAVNEHNPKDYLRTALMYAAGVGNKDCVRALLDGNAAKDEKDSEGNTAYDYAVAGDFTEVASLLKMP